MCFRIPPNVRFSIPTDFESLWTFGEDSWDLIHLQMLCGSVTSWPNLYQKVFQYVLHEQLWWWNLTEGDFLDTFDPAMVT